MVSNGCLLGGGFQFAIRADATDGLPDIIIIQNSELQDPTEINKHKKGEEAITNGNDIYYSQYQTVVWLTEIQNNITVTFDGEPIGFLPGLFRINPHSLTIRYDLQS